MDAEWLARLQFAVTVGFHFLFPPLTIGLSWLLVVAETLGWRRKDAQWDTIGRFFGKILGLTFAVGVATGIVMEFQFGTNWAQYSKFVGDIFGAPLAAEGVFAFFLESGFLGLYLFGRNRVPRGVHWFSALMVAIGSTLSAFWIIVANSWQQTPAGYVVQNGRAELTDFWAAVFNPSTIVRYSHTLLAAIVAGAFLMAAVAAYLLLKQKSVPLAQKAMKLAVFVGLAASLLTLFPSGHEHAKQVAHTQPAKFAAIEGLYISQSGAPMVLFGLPSGGPPPMLRAPIEIPGLLSWMAFGDPGAHIQGIDAFPLDERPPLALTFVSFHSMVGLGLLFIGMTALAAFWLWRGTFWKKRWMLKAFLWAVPLPLLACQLGWLTAEVGRQPWIVQGLLKTKDALSLTVSAGEILASLVMFTLVYLLLGALYLFLLIRKVRQGPEPQQTKEVTA